MTTIAYRDGVLATDSRALVGGWRAPYAVVKMWRLSDGSVVAGSGDLARVTAMKDWLEEGNRDAKQPDLTDASVYHLLKDRTIVVYELGGSFVIAADFAAWGSGLPPALGALHMGATAEQAVRIATLVDDGTGGDVVSMKVE